VLVPDAQANLAPIPDGLTDEQVLMCPDIMSTGFKGAENANIRIGDTVVVFAQGPIGLCATAGARLLGATTIIAVDGNDHRLGIAKKMGADVTLNFKNCDVVDEIMKITGGRGADSVPSRRWARRPPSNRRCACSSPAAPVQPGRVFRRPEDSAVAFAAGLGDHRSSPPCAPAARSACAA
jgi:hypothetical protein